MRQTRIQESHLGQIAMMVGTHGDHPSPPRLLHAPTEHRPWSGMGMPQQHIAFRRPDHFR